MALLLESGLLLMLIPWSSFWEHNYFIEASSAVARVLTSNYARGAISGLGLVNLVAALGELADLFRPNAPEPPRADHSR